MQQMQRSPATMLIALISAAVMIPVLAITLLFLVDITGPIMATVNSVNGGIAGTSADNIATDTGFIMFATVGVLSIPASIVLALLLRGVGGDSPNVSRRGPL